MQPLYHPRAIHARIASGCNLACNFCERELLGPGRAKKPGIIVFNDDRPPLDLSKDMDEEVWEQIVEQLFPYTDNVELGGLGEPTMGKLFGRACADIAAADKHLFFFSNGHNLGRRSVIEAVQAVRRVRVSISIDAGTPETYAKVRGGNLDTLIEAVELFRSECPHAVLCSQFTATAANIDDLPAFVSLCERLGIGLYMRGAEIVVAGAHHHVTDRATESVRFAASRTQRAIDLASKQAAAAGLWLISRLPTFSQVAADAIDDGSDPTTIRRYGDLIVGDEPCIIIIEPPPPEAARYMGKQAILAPQQLYIDHTGEVWTCLARHKLGMVSDGWVALVDENPAYQAHLAYYVGHNDTTPSICRRCPNLA